MYTTTTTMSCGQGNILYCVLCHLLGKTIILELRPIYCGNHEEMKMGPGKIVEGRMLSAARLGLIHIVISGLPGVTPEHRAIRKSRVQIGAEIHLRMKSQISSSIWGDTPRSAQELFMTALGNPGNAPRCQKPNQVWLLAKQTPCVPPYLI